jgi:undecaprenyl phosphate-alpha-L-ara4N flippase subunit ArnE
MLSSSQLALIFCTVIALAAGQVLFKLTAGSISIEPGRILQSLFNWKLVLALTIYAIATVMWIVVLRTTPLRVAYPFIALGFVIVPVLSHYLLGESISWKTFAGALLIGAGVWISVL